MTSSCLRRLKAGPMSSKPRPSKELPRLAQSQPKLARDVHLQMVFGLAGAMHLKSEQPCSQTLHLRVAMKIVKLRFWIEMLGLASAIACVLALFLATLGAAAGAAGTESESGQPQSSAVPPSVQPQSYEGMITDTHCGAKHSAAVGMAAGDCTRVCVHGGEHFALVNGDRAYILEGDQSALKQAAGQRVKIVGTLSGTTISVASVTSTAS
jgi:hypothetical protein